MQRKSDRVRGSHKRTKGLVATVGTLLGRITSGSGVSIITSTDRDREVFGLSEKASKASAVSMTSSLYCLVEDTVVVLAIEEEDVILTRWHHQPG